MKYTILLLTILISACSLHKSPHKLKLLKGYELQTQNKYETSGLTLWNGEFYTVSDKHSTILHLKFINDQVILEPFIQIDIDSSIQLDLEGITHDDENFYLISEKNFQILKISKNGKHQNWMPDPNILKQEGQKVGLFQKRNAYLEGICYLSKDHFLLVAERDPRGFIEATFKGNEIDSVDAYLSNESKYTIPSNRSTDFTGLSCDEDVYILERNAYIVSKLKKHKGQFIESRGWSYQSIIERPEFLYQDMRYGQAEGLVVKGDKIYIILDNNKNPHQNNSKNNNALFLELQM